MNSDSDHRQIINVLATGSKPFQYMEASVTKEKRYENAQGINNVVHKLTIQTKRPPMMLLMTIIGSTQYSVRSVKTATISIDNL